MYRKLKLLISARLIAALLSLLGGTAATKAERTTHETMFISEERRSCVLHAQSCAAFRRRYLEPEHINGKSAYTVTFNSDDLVKKSVAALDEKLYVPAVEFVDLQ